MPPPTRAEVKAVFRDFARDGRVNEKHSCAAVREAIDEVKSRFFVSRDLTGATDAYCEGPVGWP